MKRKETMMLTNDKMIEMAKDAVVEYFNSNADITDKNGKITRADVFVVWFCKTLQHFKALVSTTVSDGMYYEYTFNGDKNEAYLDAYKKWKNKAIKYADNEEDERVAVHGFKCND